MPWPVFGPAGDYIWEAPKLPARHGLVFNGGMAMLNFDVFEAFKSAGVDDDEKARKAAEALAQDQGRFAKIEGTLQLHSWMLAVNTAMLIAVLWRVFTP